MSPTFNQAELMDRIDGDVEFLGECIEIFDEDSTPLLEQIRGAVATQDAEALVTPAHTLKGMLSNFCAPAAEGAARDLEMRGREDTLRECDAIVAALDDELKRLRVELQSFMESLRS
ncbi:MAG: Hpt domain-containing protein [Planctomycetota bacterium]|jgi:HPt (histidine-containing phosphotransfer) domain-containing protein